MADRSGIKVTASDALEFESVAPKVRKGGGVIKTLIFALLAVFVGAGGWAYYGDRLMSLVSSSDDEIPIIRADISPIKVRPENPGGLQVPDRDKLVYDRILNGGSGESRATVERLLPPPESPLPVPESAPASDTVAPAEPEPAAPSIASTPRVSDVTAAVRPEPAPATPSPADAQTSAPALSNAPNGSPTRLAKSDPAPAAVKAPPPPAPPKQAAPEASAPQQEAAVSPAPVPAATPSDKVYRVQLAAARTAEAARKEWDRLRRGNLDLLGDLGLSVTKIDLGGTKGIFYRLRAGPLSGDAQARALCKELAKRKIGCLVVRPGK